MNGYGYIGMLFLLAVMKGFLAFFEVTLTSIDNFAVRRELSNDVENEKYNKLKKFLDNPSDFLVSIRVCNYICVLLMAFVYILHLEYTGFLGVGKMGAYFGGQPIDPSFTPLSQKFYLEILFVLLTVFLILIFGDLIPKKIGEINPLKHSVMAVRVMSPLVFLLKPVTFLANFFTELGLRVLNLHNEDDNKETEKEILMMIESSGDECSLDKEEIEMITNIFGFDDVQVGDIATHRTEIIALSTKSEESEILELITEMRHSRIPVCGENIDDIVGVLHIKDLMKYLIETRDFENLNGAIQKIMRKPTFIPVSKKTNDLFKEMQASKVHMAIILDEYGGVEGVVTMEDLIEEIMGNIFDEHDEEELDIQKISDAENKYLVSGKVSLEEISVFFDIELPVDDFETLSGFLIGQLDRIPDDGDVSEIEYGKLSFKVKTVQDKRIDEVEIIVNDDYIGDADE